VQERAVGAVDQRGRLLEPELAHVAEPEVEAVAARLASLREHRGRRVDPDHLPTDRLGHGDRDAAGAHRELDDRPVRLLRELEVEGDVLRHVGRPPCVVLGERLRIAHVPIEPSLG
jgi:hypothetical protein